MPPANITKTSLTDAAFGFITGRSGATPSGQAGLRGMLAAAFGASKRDPDRPDLNAASKALGVSSRQLRRWVRGEVTKPNPQAVQKLQRAARQAASTKRGRQRAVKAAQQAPRGGRPPGKNAIRVSGVQGVISSNDEQYRHRTTKVRISAADAEAMQNAWIEHGNAGLVDFLHDHYDDDYQTGWHFLEIDEIEWDTTRA